MLQQQWQYIYLESPTAKSESSSSERVFCAREKRNHIAKHIALLTSLKMLRSISNLSWKMQFSSFFKRRNSTVSHTRAMKIKKEKKSWVGNKWMCLTLSRLWRCDDSFFRARLCVQCELLPRRRVSSPNIGIIARNFMRLFALCISLYRTLLLSSDIFRR